MRIALVAEDASPLTHATGSEPASQEARVAALARELAKQSHDVTVFARKDAADLPGHSELAGGVKVEHITAGPADALSGEMVLPHLRTFAAQLSGGRRPHQPGVIHPVRRTRRPAPP